MALCGRRNRSKLIVGIFCVSVVGYFLFLKRSGNDVGVASRRGVSTNEQKDIEYEKLRRPVYDKPPLDMSALGELGRAVKLDLTGEEQNKELESINKHQINTYVSDKISLHRRLPERWNPL